MKSCKEYIASGILELYVLGQTTLEEDEEVKLMAGKYPEIGDEILAIGMALENYALENAVTPGPITRPFLLATIDYMDRMKNGEPFSSPPVLTGESKIDDYEQWINRDDMILPENFETLYAKILSYTPELLSAIVWIEKMAPQEVHDDEYEKFLILEGTCDISIEEDVFSLKSGDYLTIPLYKNHHVTVTSTIPCKVILQRVAV
jgi:mannose-6-phosphate isomerase-like protein (cupin superfamily)